MILSPSTALAADIIVSAAWSETINAGDLVAGAGSDLQSSYESAPGAFTLSISNTGGGSWQVLVSRTDTNWPGAFVLEVRRTSAGTGGSVSGGTSYVVVGTSETLFFSGSGDVSGIGIQLRLSEVSVAVPPDPAYSTTVTYRVTP